MIGRTVRNDWSGAQSVSPISGWRRISASSSAVNGAGFSSTESGTPTLPMSCRYPPRCSACKSSAPIPSARPSRTASRDSRSQCPLVYGSRASIVSARATKRGLGRVQRVDQLLDARQRTNTGPQLVRMNGLGEILVRAGFDAVDAIGQIGLTGDQHHRRQARSRVGFQLAADLEAVHERHRHIEENYIWFLSVNGGQRRGAVWSEHDIVAVGAEHPMKEQADALLVIGDQHAAAPRARA